jgi:NADPH2:quinone reductase
MPLTWATAVGLVRRAVVGAGEKVLVTSAAGGVGGALASVLDTTSPGVVVGGIGSGAKHDHLHQRYLPVLRGDDFYPRAVAAAGDVFDVVLDSVGGDVLDHAAAHLAIEARLVSYGGAAGQPDPATPTYAALRSGNQTLSGFSILRLARAAPQRAGALIREAVEFDHGPNAAVPTVIAWDALLDAHLAQSEGQTTGKTVVEIA